MPSGGARLRSGPPKQEGSRNSEQIGYTLSSLPHKKYDGEIPAWPLDRKPTVAEKSEWDSLWELPQAWAWSMPENVWMLKTIADYVRVSVQARKTMQAGLWTQRNRLADQIGMTLTGLAALGWKIEPSKLADGTTAGMGIVEAKARSKSGGSRARLKVV